MKTTPMTINPELNLPLPELASARKEVEQLVAERDALIARRTQIVGDEKTLLGEATLDDRETFRMVADARMGIEICDRKLREVEELLPRATQKLNSALRSFLGKAQPALDAAFGVLDAEKTTLTDRALEPFRPALTAIESVRDQLFGLSDMMRDHDVYARDALSLLNFSRRVLSASATAQEQRETTVPTFEN